MKLELYRRAPALLMLIALAAGLTACGQPNTSMSTAGALEIHAFDLGFRPGNLAVARPGRYAVKLVNDGAMLHDITFADGTSKNYVDTVKYKIGDSGTLTITGGDDLRIYAPHVWTLVETEVPNGQIW